MNNIILEFTKKDDTVKDIVIDNLEKHAEKNWYRLVAYQKENNVFRILSTHQDIMDVIQDFDGKHFIKSKEVKL